MCCLAASNQDAWGLRVFKLFGLKMRSKYAMKTVISSDEDLPELTVRQEDILKSLHNHPLVISPNEILQHIDVSYRILNRELQFLSKRGTIRSEGEGTRLKWIKV